MDHFWDMVGVSVFHPVSCNLRIAVEMAVKPSILYFCKLLGAYLYQRVDSQPISTISGLPPFSTGVAIYVLRWKWPPNLPYCSFASYLESNHTREWTRSLIRPFLGHGCRLLFSTGVLQFTYCGKNGRQPSILHFCKLFGAYLYQRVDSQPI